MKRRAVLVASSVWLAAAAMPSFAQSPKSPRRIAVLLAGTQGGMKPRLDAVRAELIKLGHVEGRDILFDVRWGDDKTERLAALAAELVALDPAVILTASSAGVAACKKATSTIPIVFATAGSPVEQGFVSSLRRPGGNITGIIVHPGLNAKMVEIAREALPKAQRLAILVHDSDPSHKGLLDLIVPTAQRLKFEPLIARVGGAGDFDRAFREIAERKADLLLLPNLTLFGSQLRQLVDRALKARLPLLGNGSGIAEAGGLLNYGTSREENYRRAAALVDKILRGAKPGDLPVEQPERFELVVNLKTAKAIGVDLAPAIMLRANRVIK